MHSGLGPLALPPHAWGNPKGGGKGKGKGKDKSPGSPKIKLCNEFLANGVCTKTECWYQHLNQAAVDKLEAKGKGMDKSLGRGKGK